MANQKAQVDQLLKEVLRSSKYRNVDEQTIRNIGMKELLKTRKIKEAAKATKNKLHQIGGAYFIRKPKYSSWLLELKRAKESSNNKFRETCIKIMSFHSSTKERLDILDRFYADIFSQLPPIDSVMDVACGLNPLSIPWMPNFESLEYHAYDIYKDLIGFLDAFLDIVNIKGHAEVRDVLFDPPQFRADLALILKTIPCFDQIDRIATSTILERINADHFVISFPVKSLGGIEKMMVKNYTERFNNIVRRENWKVRRVLFKTELTFLVSKKG
jgi:16S rRNA (guanine(1405)-N(7))-methyltransferase